MSGTEILQAMEGRYREFASYRDHGVVMMRGQGEDAVECVTFETAFRRPDCFRFAWSRPHSYEPLRHLKTKKMIQYDNGRASSWRRLIGEAEGTWLEEESLSMAVAGATGASQGAAMTIARLLFPGVVPAAGMRELERLENGFLEGAPCYRVSFRNPLGDREVLSVAVEDFTLRCLSYEFPCGTIAEEIRRGIETAL